MESSETHPDAPQGPCAPASADEVTRLLADCSGGDRNAFDRLIPLVYEDLRRIAHRRLAGERPDHTLNTTAVVHEAYLHLVRRATASWKDRVHFFAVAARVIRNVLVDYARARATGKRGAGALRIPLREDLDGGAETDTIELLALDQALNELSSLDPRLERIVECRFFGGMTMKDTAEAMGISLRTAERDWTRAKAHLYRSLGPR
jgi:RNA polymerase sigma factor (TIGR02999 family)